MSNSRRRQRDKQRGGSLTTHPALTLLFLPLFDTYSRTAVASYSAVEKIKMVKDPKKPRGKMSSYAYFVQTCREEHKKKHPEASVNFSEFSKRCSERWKTMSQKEKCKFEDMAKLDKVRYEREMKTYIPPKGQKKKRFKDPNAPKRPPSAFFLFCADFRPKVKSEHPGLSIGDTAKKLGEMWNGTAAEDKQPYERKAAKLKEKYDKVFNSASSHKSSPGSTMNVSSESKFVDTVSGQRMLPPWSRTSVDAGPESYAASLRSPNRWRTQMVFSKSVYSFQVKEDTVPGTVVGKVEAESQALTPITYSVQEDDGENLFLLSPLSGEFLLSRSLDFEAQRFYILTVVLQQGGLQVSSVRVYFSVLDVNDNPPVFSQDNFSASILEDARVGTCFLSLNVSDKDEGDSGELKLKVLDGDKETLFFINSAGRLCLNKELDRERQSAYNLTVAAHDCVQQPASSQLTATAHVTVLVLDVNDNAPVFVSAKSVSAPEDTAVGAIVTTVHAEDEDAGSNGDVLYYLIGSSSGTFSIGDRSGHVYLEETLDREHVDALTLTITAMDRGSPRMETTMSLTVHVKDANDHDPKFSQDVYTLTVREDVPRGTSLFQVQAHDQDDGPNGQVRYMLNQTSPFMVDAVRGVVTVMGKLDREKDSNYDLVIKALDRGNIPRSAVAAFRVTVLDVNDFVPQFSPETLIIHVLENEEDPSLLTHQVSALDEDLGVNGQLSYSIQNGNRDGSFSITPNGTFQILHSLDREKESLYIITITAVDSGLPPLTGTLTVHVIVDDVNDHRPEFTEEVYNTIVYEDSPPGTVFAMITASDHDDGLNSEIRYFTDNPDVPFAIEETSGELLTTDVLDRETVAIYNLTFTNSPYVAHVPSELPPGSIVCAMNVDVLNYSFSEDEPVGTLVALVSARYLRIPRLLRQMQILGRMCSPPLIAIPYHMAVGNEVVQFTAVDLDVSNSSAGIQYSLNGGNASDFFWIQADDGKVQLKQSLTESINSFLTLIVVAKDQGIPPLSSQTHVTFEITGRNQYSPSFREPNVTFSIPEDLPAGSVIGRIQAEDGDYGPNGVIAYCIVPANLPLLFSVGEVSGLLTLTKELDFEREVIYHLQIKATDGGWISKTGMMNITIVVMDVNDNPPVLSFSEFLTLVPENSEIGTNVLDVKATDADSGLNAQIVYSLIAGHVDKFAIDPRSGTITTLDVFDYEQEQIFDVTVKASNIGGHNLFTLAHVVIQIVDVNEFTPAFTKMEFNFSVFKNVPVGTVVGKITATDDDQGPEGQVFYLMFGQNKHMGFNIHKLSGEIYTTGSLRKHSNSDIVLKVLAKNSGVITGVNVDESLVHISVFDTNDAPVFTSAIYLANVTEDSPVGTSVITVSALDQDSILDWNRVFFSIEGGNTNLSFAIEPLSGVISVNSPLDRETFEIYNLTVTATDNGSPPATGTTNVLVSIGDINDNTPKLTLTKAQVKENQPQGTIVTRLNASDLDIPPNQGPFMYWLVNPSTDSAFSLTPDGVLFTTRPIDRELTPIYRILLAVRDAGIPVLSSTTTFHIRIVDENDNPSLPRNIFIEVKYFGSSFQGGMLGNVHPEDPDEADTFTCSVKSGPLNMFTIPNGTCELWSSPFQGEATFNVTIEAADQFHVPVNNSIYVKYKGFTNASIDSCILFYVSSSSMEEFLSNKYLRFVKALDSLFNQQASKTHVFGIKSIGSEILMLAAVKNYNGEYLSREVARGISTAHKKLLESQSNVSISHITSDPCLTSLCQNGAVCNKNIYISQDVAVLESLGVIFVSPQKEGNCVNSVTGFSCQCPFGVTGVHCEENSYGFEELSFMEFPPLDRRTNLISLEFATVQSNSMLIYNPGGLSNRDYFALEILEGTIHLSYNLGSGPVRLQTKKQVADGHFHSVSVRRIGSMGSLHVDNCTDVENSGFCFSQSDSSSSERTLDVGNNNMTFGGMRTIEFISLQPAPIKTHDFVGCIRNIHVNGIQLRPSTALATYNIRDRCPRATVSPCHSDPCKNGGVCRDVWSDFVCECKSPFIGSDCATEMSAEVVLRFSGNDYVEYVIKERFRRDFLLKESLSDKNEGSDKDQTVMSIKFRTKDSGVLLFVIGQTGFIVLTIKDRKPLCLFKESQSGHLLEFTVDATVADGLWHVLSLSSGGHVMFLTLDGKAVLNITDRRMDLTPARVEKIVLGAALTDDAKLQQPGFSGCLQDFTVTGYTLPATGHNVMVDIRPSRSLTKSSCVSPGFCLPSPCSDQDPARRHCLSGQCPDQWSCGPIGQNRSCICLHNLSDSACDICISTTGSSDRCSETQGSASLWLIAVILPLTSGLVIIGMFVVFYRVRRRNSQRQSLPQKTEDGADNAAFCFDDNRPLTNAASAGKERQREPTGADQQRTSVDLYSDASPSNIHPQPKSELDYCEIGSISSASQSDSASLKLSCHKHFYGTKRVKADSKQWRDLKMLLTGFQKKDSSEETAKCPLTPSVTASPDKQLISRLDAEQPQLTSPAFMKTVPQSQLPEPVQCLTCEEICKLNAPLEQSTSSEVLLGAKPADSAAATVSSDSETDSTFTCSESEYGQFSVVKHGHEQQGILPVGALFKQNRCSGARQQKYEGLSSSKFEQWENILNTHLPFSSYVPVFEDIACLPLDTSHSNDVQSDVEEII
ncbi:protocadherin Fat 4-like [Solea senegalensis]|uniref:High mobility group protein B2 n=1 Tax=Solea senegalensis TaxID=28829 RepID=A0AAV6PVE8_SOLSE|nr:protocadherin Fat 4-like [Solea senegalensis]